MAITNFVITTNGAGYAESDGLNPIASTEATVVIKNNIVSIVLSDGSSWKSTPLENCTLNGNPLSTDPRVAIDQLALAGFRTPSGGSGGGAVDSWNGQTGNVVYDVFRKADGVTPADSYNEDIEHEGELALYNDGSLKPLMKFAQSSDRNNPTSNIYSLDVLGLLGQGGNVHQQEVIYNVDKPYGNIYPHLGSTVLAIAPSTANTDTAAYSLVVTQPDGASPVNRPLFNISNGFNNASQEVFKIINTGQLKLNNYTGANFDGEGQFLIVDSTGLVKKSVGSTLTVISWLTRHRGTLASPITISSTPVDLTSVLGNLTLTSENGIITYDAVNNVFKADANTTSYYAFDVVIRLTGTVQGGGTSSFIFELRRPDNVTIITSDYSRIGGTGNLLNTQVSAIDTRVFSGGTDNYQTQGFRIFGRKVDGNNLILSNGVDDFQELILER